MSVSETLDAFWASTTGQAALGLMVIAITELLLGVLADIRNGGFRMKRIDRWLRQSLAGKVLPLWILLFVGHYSASLTVGDFDLLLIAGVGASALYIATAIGQHPGRLGAALEPRRMSIDARCPHTQHLFALVIRCNLQAGHGVSIVAAATTS